MNDRETIDLLWAPLGGKSRQYSIPRPGDIRPLPDRVRQLIDWICAHRPEPFRRTIPTSRDDHDELIHWTLVDLIAMVDRLEMDLDAALCELARDEQRDAIYDPHVLGMVCAWQDQATEHRDEVD